VVGMELVLRGGTAHVVNGAGATWRSTAAAGATAAAPVLGKSSNGCCHRERAGGACALALLLGLLERPGERAASAEDQHLDRRLGEVELLGDLPSRESLPLAQEDRAALVLGHLLEGLLDPDQLERLLTFARRDDLLQNLEVVGRL